MTAGEFRSAVFLRPRRFTRDDLAAIVASVRIAAKLAIDRCGACTGLLLLAPLLLIAALAIKLDSPGPILFRQRRNGCGQRPFTILKFRTMRVESDPVTQASRADGRVTRVGRLLRRSSLDEMPQLVNVLCGDMSLVGPRPHAIAHDEHYRSVVADYSLRHAVRPGMTGWAQVNGLRGATPASDAMARRVDHDLWYIANWSVALDLRILARTVGEVCRCDAY